MSHAVIIKNAVKKYGDFTALNGVSLDIKQGEFFTLLGPSGCGKTTLLRMIAGFNTVDGGEICFDDRVINNLEAHKRDIGMVFQNYAIFPHLTVAENAKLQTVGFRTALDDFGAGYSILNTVIDIPVNTVKVDRAFISNCETTHKGIYFLREIINLLKGLGYHIVCEGVETPEQASILRNTMCDEVQGYWFSHPVPAHEFEKMLQEGR